MEHILQNIIYGVSLLGPPILLLGLLIFVHEFGHFSVAKYYGIRVEVFSMGFGRKIFQKTYGDTTYCLSLVPLGGYVKMYGDDPSADVPAEQKKYSFLHQPLWPRTAVVLAGPLMNAVFAFFIFVVLAIAGEEGLIARLGDVSQGTQAYDLGFRSGDRILKVDDRPISRWKEFLAGIESHAGREMVVEIQRESSAENISLKVTPISVDNKDLFSFKTKVGKIEGILAELRAPVVGIQKNTSPAYLAGMRTGDLVSKLNGEEIKTWDELNSKIEQIQKSNVQNKIHVEISRLTTDKKVETKELEIALSSGQTAGIEAGELYLSDVVKDMPACDGGLRLGDRLDSVNGQKLEKFETFQKMVQSYKVGDPAFKIGYLRNGELKSTELTPKVIVQPDEVGNEKETLALGVKTTFQPTYWDPVKFKQTTLWGITTTAFDNTVDWTVKTALSFLRLIQGRVSAKSIGGPIMIGKLANDTWEHGFRSFLRVMAIISINLFILNLLPVPVLDGGHLLLFSIEFAKGSPLSFKKVEILQQVGMFLLLGLMMFAVYNDVMRGISKNPQVSCILQ